MNKGVEQEAMKNVSAIPWSVRRGNGKCFDTQVILRRGYEVSQSLSMSVISGDGDYYYNFYLLLFIIFVQVYCGLKSCTSLLENVSLCVPTSNLRDFSLFGVSPSNKQSCSVRLCCQRGG
jgi:hypothetical protein